MQRTMKMWAVYEAPEAQSGRYVAQKWEFTAGRNMRTPETVMAETLWEMHAKMKAKGLRRLEREPEEATTVREAWM